MLSLVSLLGFLLLFVIGHSLGALLVYFNHRYVFHGRLRRWPVLKYLARLHGLHHAHAEDNGYIFVPWWGRVAIIFSLGLAAYISIPLSLGLGSFCLLYMYRHWAIHNTDFSSKFFHHHDLHHKKYPNKNFSGMYPVIDRIFGTSKDA